MPAGRPKGSLNKATHEVKEIARKHGPKAIERLAYLSHSAQTETAQVAACKEILDRAYGKATQIIAGDDQGGPIQVTWLPSA